MNSGLAGFCRLADPLFRCSGRFASGALPAADAGAAAFELGCGAERDGDEEGGGAGTGAGDVGVPVGVGPRPAQGLFDGREKSFEGRFT